MPTFTVPDMSCGHCVNAITKAIQAVDADAKVETDLEAKKVHIESRVNDAALAELLTNEGYPPA